ncbi:MAG: hypothetical protein P8M80_17235, partial [Pirellulaceae bacterium]|nr:hypothetical protein [Pirellulaceae bacterium]
MNPLVEIITSDQSRIRDQSLDSVCEEAKAEELLAHAIELDKFRRTSVNLYHQVRALFFLSAIYRFHIPKQLAADNQGPIPFAGYE